MDEAYSQMVDAAKAMDCDGLEAVFDEMSAYLVPKEEEELWSKLKAANDAFNYDEITSLLAARVHS